MGKKYSPSSTVTTTSLPPPLYVFVIADKVAFLFLCRSEDFRQALIAWAITQSNSGKFSFFRFFASPADVMFSRLSPKGGLCKDKISFSSCLGNSHPLSAHVIKPDAGGKIAFQGRKGRPTVGKKGRRIGTNEPVCIRFSFGRPVERKDDAKI